MGMFGNILKKLGIKKDNEEKEAAPVVKKEVPKGRTEAPKRPTTTSTKRPSVKPRRAEPRRSYKEKPTPAASAAVPMVDVLSKLETMAKGTKLDWKVSIVDLLKVLDIDSSLSARKELANELGCPPDLIGGDYAEMNVWLHKKVLAEIAANGGNIPSELLD
jgi:hypothetical protein